MVVINAGPNTLNVQMAPVSIVPNPIAGTLAGVYNQVDEFEGITAFTYQQNGSSYLHIEDGSGAHDYLIPGSPLSATTGYRQSKVIIVSPTEFWHAYDYSGNKLYVANYQIVNGTIIVASNQIVDNASVLLDFKKLASGKLIIAYQSLVPTPASNTVDIGFAYLNSLGNWVLTPHVNLTNAGCRGSLSQHPQDNSIWFFEVGDGSAQIAAIHLTESGNTLTMDWAKLNFIPWVPNNAMTPDTEYPWIASVPDPVSNSIIIAYQNIHWTFFYSGGTPIVKGCYVAVARVSANGTKSLLFELKHYIERIDTFVLGVKSGQAWLAYGEIDPSDFSYNNLHLTEGSNTQSLGKMMPNTGGYSLLHYCHSSNLLIAEMVDGLIHFYPV